MKKFIFIPVLFWAIHAQSQGIIAGIEWWINGNYEQAVFQPVVPTEVFDGIIPVDFNSFPSGEHALFFRYKSNSGKWSPVITHTFIKTPAGSDSSLITAVQFWTDDPPIEVVTQAIDPPVNSYNDVLSLNTSFLSTGKSSLYYRFKDSNGKWSQPLVRQIAKTPSGDDKVYIAAMEYWFDNDSENSSWHFFDGESAEVNSTIPVSLASLDGGTHLVEIRFYNNLGQMSEVNRSFIKKLPEGLEQNEISAYRYWFNNDPLTIVQNQFSQSTGEQGSTITLSLNAFNPNDTVLVSLQFLDKLGRWSVIHSDSVIVYDNTSIENRKSDPFRFIAYPNPVKQGAEVFLEWEQTTMPGRIVVADSKGRAVFQQLIESPETGNFQLNTQFLGRGVYYINFVCVDGSVTKRLVVL